MVELTAWNVFWKAVKGYLGWLFFLAVFILVASFTFGFRAYCPLESFIVGSIVVFLLMLVLGWAMGAWKD